jgi:deoxyhypusine synthase
MAKKRFLRKQVRHVDITAFDATPVIDAMREMSFSSRDTAAATDIFERMLRDPGCTVFLTLAGSTSAGGCMQVYADMVKYNMVDAVVATGASIVDMDFFEALGFKHYQGSPSRTTASCAGTTSTGSTTPTSTKSSSRPAT